MSQLRKLLSSLLNPSAELNKFEATYRPNQEAKAGLGPAAI